MEIRVEDHSGVSVFTLRGDPGPDGELSDKIHQACGQDGGRIVIDLSGLRIINSAQLGDLVRLTAEANTQGGRLVLANPTPFVEGVLETTRLNKFFEIHADVRAAVQAVA